MTLLRRIDHWLFKGVSALAQLFLIGAVAAGFWQVVARFVLSSPLDWSEVLTRALLIWAVLLGALGGMASNGILGMFLGATLLAIGYRIFMTWVNEGQPALPQDK